MWAGGIRDARSSEMDHSGSEKETKAPPPLCSFPPSFLPAIFGSRATRGRLPGWLRG